ncbi:RNA-binding protein [Phycicoccus jejuensis]|uniref:Jag family protein n=1 Tax=Phycicoccus jejuensis TaxID=367299 RepID=UPI0004C3ADFC|nr:R3H domain-containing nucleic acid-binding protein [Phycicoccus jejuensis]
MSENTTEGTAPTADETTPLAAELGAAETAGAVTPGEATTDTPGGVQHETSADAANATSDDADGGADPAGDETAAPAAGQRRPARRQQLEREGEVAADFLETLLDICDLDGDLDVDIDGDRAAVAIVDSEEGRVPRRLVGQDGQVLEALQELTRLAVQSETGERSRLMLDVAGHRAGRRAELVRIAKEAIATVQSSGESASLEPMSAFERKVVHDEVLSAGLHSESEGSEPRRYVVITAS